MMERLHRYDEELLLLEHTAAVLQWDQETFMPERAVEERSRQLSLLSEMMHRRITDPEIAAILHDLGADDAHPSGDPQLDPADRALVRRWWRQVSRMRKLPASWVKEFSELTSQAQVVWAQSRRNRDFSRFQTVLERIITMVRKKSELYGYEAHPYDPLLDEYEPDLTTERVESLFTPLKQDLVELLRRLEDTPAVEDRFLYQEYPADLQKHINTMVLEHMGFDWRRGRLDESAHPFTTALAADDVRITTRYHEPSGVSALFSAVHEGGHALYEQGARSGPLRGTSLGSGVSLALHESQSRLWEQMVGRSREFWIFWFPQFQQLFERQLQGVGLEQFLLAVNRVRPSCIRVDADEVTYSLHIMLRFELEKALVSGGLHAADLPHAWNEQMQSLVGSVPSHDGEGVLQDVHWSAGMFGYFPTYALGNLYAAQLYEQMNREIPDMRGQIVQGSYGEIHRWLKEQVHQWGGMYSSEELIHRVTGKPLDPGCFTGYLRRKYGVLYGV